MGAAGRRIPSRNDPARAGPELGAASVASLPAGRRGAVGGGVLLEEPDEAGVAGRGVGERMAPAGEVEVQSGLGYIEAGVGDDGSGGGGATVLMLAGCAARRHKGLTAAGKGSSPRACRPPAAPFLSSARAEPERQFQDTSAGRGVNQSMPALVLGGRSAGITPRPARGATAGDRRRRESRPPAHAAGARRASGRSWGTSFSRTPGCGAGCPAP